jgi:hypothetical protein
MASYTDELDAVIAAEQRLRAEIALAMARDDGGADRACPSPRHLAAADAAIDAWAEEGEEALDQRAFRPLTPLQELLAEHRSLLERIADIQDRRLS